MAGVSSDRNCLLAAGLLVVCLALGRLLWLPVLAPLDVNEGWNAGQAMRAFGAGALYPDPDSLIANNYPPLSFYIVGGFGRLVGDNVIAGRIFALLAQLACGAAIWAMVARFETARTWKMVGALMFGGFSVTLLRSYLAMNDPQWLGSAAMSWAIVVLMPRHADQAPNKGAIVFSASLMVVGGLIKHNLVAFPIAATIWLLLVDRRGFVIWMATGIALMTAIFAILSTAWGTIVFTDILFAARSYSWTRMLAKGGPLLLAIVPAMIACHPLISRRDDMRFLLLLLLLAVAIPIGVLQRSGSGVNVNAFFECVIAMAMAVPIATTLRERPTLAWVGICMLPALCLLPGAAARNFAELRGRDAAMRHAAPFISAIGKAAGPVACDDQALCYWAKRESEIDFFSVNQRLLNGGAAALAPALAERRFAMIQMRSENPGWQQNRLLPLIRKYYSPVYRSGGMELLVPMPDTVPAAR